MDSPAVWYCRTAAVKQVLIDVLLDMDSQPTAAERGETDEEMDKLLFFFTCLNVLYIVIRRLHSLINTEHSLNDRVQFYILVSNLVLYISSCKVHDLGNMKNNKHSSLTSFLFCQPLLSLIHPTCRSSIAKQLYLLLPSIFSPDDSKRAPKGPTFADFLSQGRTQGSRGERGRGRGRGQKPSYR